MIGLQKKVLIAKAVHFSPVLFVVYLFRAHWYLAVICFPGLERLQIEPNPLYQPQSSSQPRGSALPSGQLRSSVMGEGGTEEPSPHTEPISFNQFEGNGEGEALCEHSAGMPPCAHKSTEHTCGHGHGINGQGKVQPHYTGESPECLSHHHVDTLVSDDAIKNNVALVIVFFFVLT